MDCPFCAEQIKDAAILCRFCGARKVDGDWQEPTASPSAGATAKPAGQFTMHFAAVCFLASAVFEVLSIQTAVPLVGALRGGAVAWAYHLIYTGLFVAVGFGLWGGWRWGYRAVFGATLVYTIDRVAYLLDTRVLELQAKELTSKYGGLIPQDAVIGSIQAGTLGVMVGWWGFAFYVYLRRAYFRPRDQRVLRSG